MTQSTLTSTLSCPNTRFISNFFQNKMKDLNSIHAQVDIAFDMIRDLECQAEMLEPKLNSASDKVQELRSEVQEHREKYIQVSE